MPYAVIAVVTNFAAGISKTKISSAEVATMMRMKKQILSKWIVSLVNEL
jgi:purine nucleoside phosphorylase